MASITSNPEHRHKRQRLTSPIASEQQTISASSRVFGTPELMRLIIDELMPLPVPKPKDPSSDALSMMLLEEAQAIIPLYGLLQVSQAWRYTILGSTACRKAMFLTPASDKKDCQDHWIGYTNARQNPLLPEPFQFSEESYRRLLCIDREEVMDWLRGQGWEWAADPPRRRVVPSWVHMQLSYPPVSCIKLVAIEGAELSRMQRKHDYHKTFDHDEPRTFIVKPCPLKTSGETCPFGWGMHDCYESDKGVTLGMLVAALTKWYCYGGPALDVANGSASWLQTRNTISSAQVECASTPLSAMNLRVRDDLTIREGLGDIVGTNHTRGTVDQLVLAVVIGLGSLIGFCIIRPRWSGIYAARKARREDATELPELPNSFLGWVIPLWRITDQQVLATAGLDAYVFLRFFRMASKYLAIACFFAIAVIMPVHDNYDTGKNGDDEKGNNTSTGISYGDSGKNSTDDDPKDNPWPIDTDYLWMYLVFAYVFSILLMYMIVSNTRKVIEVRQEYLGTQTTRTDRTIRLSGIPADLQSEEKIKQFMEQLNIGKVESVTLCRNWYDLDTLMASRKETLRKLEEALVSYHGSSSGEVRGPDAYHDDPDDDHTDLPNGQAHVPAYSGKRPLKTIRYGRFWLQTKKVDAIDYYQDKLQSADKRIAELRRKDFAPTPLAFITMDTVAACQMAVQAVLDPSPLQLLATQSPAPADIVWENTYLSRRTRMFRSWSITALIVILTVVWSLVLIPLATALNVETIKRVLPAFGNWLKQHEFANSLVETQIPTIIASLLTIAVPYAYDWLATCQGMTSRADIEMSVISKNFFFTFFNFFIIFTVLGTASNAYSLFNNIEKQLRNTTVLLHTLAKSLSGLIGFYTNFLILQAIGLLPLKLLQMGSLSLYPFYRIGAKTPRDFAELAMPATFSYGLYLPQTLLIFDICLVYSVLKDSWKVLVCGLAYFVIGGFVFKYQLLYAMDQRQHSTGRSWIMMCDRTLVGLVVFQLTVGGQVILKNINARGALLLPLLIGTIWFSYVYNRTYRPLMQFIALKSVRQAEVLEFPGYMDSGDLPEDLARWRDASETRSRDSELSRERKMQFNNPNLFSTLEAPWTSGKVPPASVGIDGSDNDEDLV